MGLILFREAFNLGRILNEARFNLVELRAGKGGDGAAFGRFFSCVGVSTGRGGQLGDEREKGRENGLKGAKARRGGKKRGRKEGEKRAPGRVFGLFWARVGASTGCSCMMLRAERLKGA